jgi:hypothetical protein
MFGLGKKVTIKDATVEAGPNGVSVECRNLKKHYSFEEFGELVYPAIDQAAKAEEGK